jgi:hypothetical protein
MFAPRARLSRRDDEDFLSDEPIVVDRMRAGDAPQFPFIVSRGRRLAAEDVFFVPSSCQLWMVQVDLTWRV